MDFVDSKAKKRYLTVDDSTLRYKVSSRSSLKSFDNYCGRFT